MLLKEGSSKIRRCNVQNILVVLEESMVKAPDVSSRRLQQGTNTGAWLSVPPSTVNGMELEDQAWYDVFFIHYSIDLPHTPLNCDGLGAAFPIFHALD